jgi:hypothetical protein
VKTIKSQRIGLLTKVLEEPGGTRLVVSALAFFPFQSPGALASEVAMWKLAAEELGRGRSAPSEYGSARWTRPSMWSATALSGTAA